MAKMLDKVLNFVGWETEEENDEAMETKDNMYQPDFLYDSPTRKQQSKIVSLHTASHFKMVVVHPEAFDEAQGICDHLKAKKPVIVNLEDVDKEEARRIVDFLSGSVYALDGNIQKVSTGIFIIAPNNVDIMGDFKDEFRNKVMFPWTK